VKHVSHLLLIEDDSDLASGLNASLAQSGYDVTHLTSGGDAVAACDGSNYDVVVLDLGLPDIDGIEALKRMREKGLRAPVLILTARDGLKDRVNGLDAGADDYLGKPFELMELEARVRALLRRTRAGDPEAMKFGSISFDNTERQMFVKGKPLLLTAREIAVLEALLAKAGRIVSKENIFSSIYDMESDASTSAIEVYVSRVRKKLDAAGAGVGIRVLRGLGYRLELADEAVPA
jgi:two-component system OmpR family response regulator